MRRSKIASPWRGRLSVNRPSMLAIGPKMLAWAKELAERRQAGIVDLFDNTAGPVIPELPDWSLDEKLWNERKALGAFLSGHPATEYRQRNAHHITHGIGELDDLLDAGTHGDIVVCGLLVQRFYNSFNVNIVLEDETGRAEVSLSRDNADRYAYLLNDDAILLARLTIYYGKRAKYDVEKLRHVGTFTAPASALARGSKRG